jgi:2-dehydro-3-deoxygalactonokinase
LEKNGLSEGDVICVLASGMITSEFGLCRLDHISAPAGLEELHGSIREIKLEEITEIPFVFIRGVKVASESFESFDVMRGEETELMGVINTEYGECVYVLPGSHSKIISVDGQGRIVDFSTMLTGEMIGALAGQTILRDAVDLGASQLDCEYLLLGYDYADREGINKALFKVRVLKSFMERDKNQVYSFFLGAVLAAEIRSIIDSSIPTVVIGGRAQIKNAMGEILTKRDSKRVILLDGDTVDMSTSLGAIRVYEFE